MFHIGADLLLLAGAEVREVGHPKSPQVKRVLVGIGQYLLQIEGHLKLRQLTKIKVKILRNNNHETDKNEKGTCSSVWGKKQ